MLPLIRELTGRERILAVLLVILAVASGVSLLWSLLSGYISPESATQRKDVVNMFVLSAAAFVGTVTAIVAVGNLFISRSNLEQQRELDDRRRQDEALQNYFGQMGELLTTHKLMDTTKADDPRRSLARAHTATVLRRLEGSRRKRDVALFLEGAGLINKDNAIVSLVSVEFDQAYLSGATLSRAALAGAFLNDSNLEVANLAEANLSGAFLARTNLSGATLTDADLSNAILSDADLSGADLSGANLSGADLVDANLEDATLDGANLSGAFLRRAKVESSQLNQTASLASAVLPDGTEHP